MSPEADAKTSLSWDESLGRFMVYHLPIAWFLFAILILSIVEIIAIKLGCSYYPSHMYLGLYFGGIGIILAALWIGSSWFRGRVSIILGYWLLVGCLFWILTGTTKGALRTAVSNALNVIDKQHEMAIREKRENR